MLTAEEQSAQSGNGGVGASGGDKTKVKDGIGFTGHFGDTESNLYYARARAYDPTIGRFLTRDPIDDESKKYSPAGLNAYQYGLNNPTVYTDPTGQWLHIVIGAIIGGIVGAATAIMQGKDWQTVLLSSVIGSCVGALAAATGGAVTGFLAGTAATSTTAATVGVLGSSAASTVIGTAAGGAVAGGIQGFGNSLSNSMLLQGKSYNDSINGALEAGGEGMLTGMVGGAVGGIGSVGGATLGSSMAFGGLAGGSVGGIRSALRGGNFWEGFAKGAASGAMGGMFGYVGGLTNNEFGATFTGMVGGTVTGAMDAEMNGGDVMQSMLMGGVTGAVSGWGSFKQRPVSAETKGANVEDKNDINADSQNRDRIAEIRKMIPATGGVPGAESTAQLGSTKLQTTKEVYLGGQVTAKNAVKIKPPVKSEIGNSDSDYASALADGPQWGERTSSLKGKNFIETYGNVLKKMGKDAADGLYFLAVRPDEDKNGYYRGVSGRLYTESEMIQCKQDFGVSAVAGIFFAPAKEASAVSGTLKLKGIQTPYGVANQVMTKEALALRQEVLQGKTLYRIGTIDKSVAGADGQFWSTVNPLSKEYAKMYGIPAENMKNFDFINAGTLKTGQPFIVRPAPGFGNNPGGALEIVTPPKSVNIDWLVQWKK